MLILGIVIFIIIALLLLYVLLRFNRPQQKREASSRPTHLPYELNPTMLQAKQDNEQANAEGVPLALANFELLAETSMDKKIKKKIATMTHDIPRPHPILLSLARGISGPEELSALIKGDPQIAAKILRTVNSAAFSLTQKITSINHAVVYLGITLVKDIVMQLAVRESIKLDDKQQQQAYEKLWMASYVASSAALHLAQKLNLSNASELSTQALLASIGNIALLSFRPALSKIYIEDISLFERNKFEQDVLAANAPLIGAMLVKQWELPSVVEHSIAQSLIPMAVPPNQCNAKGDWLRSLVLCYTACRIGDLVAFHGVREVDEINLLKQENLEFFYLPYYLQKAGLTKIHDAFKDVAFCQKLNKLIDRVAKP